jgi:predicted nucleotidyltransferase
MLRRNEVKAIGWIPTRTMDSTAAITLPLQEIAVLCGKYGVEKLDVFGSVLRDDFSPESDVDFLVVFKNNDYGPWMSKLVDFEEDLSKLLGRRVDVMSRHGVGQSENYIRRRHILSSARTLYKTDLT